MAQIQKLAQFPLMRKLEPQFEKPRSVYVHIPFCRHRCGYCNFTLEAGRDYLTESFLSALQMEVEWLDQTYEVDTVFLGGGTPSHLSPDQLKKLHRILQSRFQLATNAEFSAECNPGDLCPEKARALAEIGVNRISLGVQSLNSAKLKLLERDHDAEIVRSAVRNARQCFGTLSIDLIFAAPGETLEEWKADLEAALELGPDHLSTYELTFEKGTRFWNRKSHGQLIPNDNDLCCEMFEYAISICDAVGLRHYEVSNFAKSDFQCRHNLAYWTGRSYFAFGPGASSFINGIRKTNHRSTTHYIRKVMSGEFATEETEHLTGKRAALEQLVIGLRLRQGVNGSTFKKRTGNSAPGIDRSSVISEDAGTGSLDI